MMVTKVIDGLIDGKSKEEISQETGLSVSDVEDIQNSALVKLRLEKDQNE